MLFAKIKFQNEFVLILLFKPLWVQPTLLYNKYILHQYVAKSYFSLLRYSSLKHDLKFLTKKWYFLKLIVTCKFYAREDVFNLQVLITWLIWTCSLTHTLSQYSPTQAPYLVQSDTQISPYFQDGDIIIDFRYYEITTITYDKGYMDNGMLLTGAKLVHIFFTRAHSTL